MAGEILDYCASVIEDEERPHRMIDEAALNTATRALRLISEVAIANRAGVSATTHRFVVSSTRKDMKTLQSVAAPSRITNDLFLS